MSVKNKLEWLYVGYYRDFPHGATISGTRSDGERFSLIGDVGESRESLKAKLDPFLEN
jgi:hypothetical protein